MTRETGPLGPQTSFSEDGTGRIDREPNPDASDRDSAEEGCLYETPAGPCGDRGTVCTVGGVRVELCEGHLEAVLYEKGLAAPPGTPKGRIYWKATNGRSATWRAV